MELFYSSVTAPLTDVWNKRIVASWEQSREHIGPYYCCVGSLSFIFSGAVMLRSLLGPVPPNSFPHYFVEFRRVSYYFAALAKVAALHCGYRANVKTCFPCFCLSAGRLGHQHFILI